MKTADYAYGSALVIVGVLGSILLLIATANPLGLSAFAQVQWPGTVVALILSLCGVAAVEGGLALIRRGDPGGGAPSPSVPLFSAIAGVVTVVVMLVLFAVGLGWAVTRTQSGVEPTSETYVVAGALGLYTALRVALMLSGMRAAELAQAVGVEAAAPDQGETRTLFAVRLVIGFLIGIPLLDSLIVLVGVALAPNDTRIYPAPSDSTMVAALLWLIGLAAVSSSLSGYLRGRASTRKLLVSGITAAVTLLPAFVLDARVPLYPFIAGIFKG